LSLGSGKVVSYEKQGYSNGESAFLSPMWRGLDSGPVPYTCGLSLLMALSLLRGIFSGFSGFLAPQKPISSNSKR